MVLPSESSLDDEPYFSLFAKSESPLISLLCTCTACSFSLFFRLKDLPPFLLYDKELYPIIQCQKISQLSDEHVLMLCRILLNVELTEDNLESWQYDSFECYDDLMEFAYSTKSPIARYCNQNIYYDGYFCGSWMDLNVTHFERYCFSATDEDPTQQDRSSINETTGSKQYLHQELVSDLEQRSYQDFEKVAIFEDHEIIEVVTNEPMGFEEVQAPQYRSTEEKEKDLKAMEVTDVSIDNLIKQVNGRSIFRETIAYLILILFGRVRIEMNISHFPYPSGTMRVKILVNLRAFSSCKVKMKLCT